MKKLPILVTGALALMMSSLSFAAAVPTDTVTTTDVTIDCTTTPPQQLVIQPVNFSFTVPCYIELELLSPSGTSIVKPNPSIGAGASHYVEAPAISSGITFNPLSDIIDANWADVDETTLKPYNTTPYWVRSNEIVSKVYANLPYQFGVFSDGLYKDATTPVRIGDIKMKYQSKSYAPGGSASFGTAAYKVLQSKTPATIKAGGCDTSSWLVSGNKNLFTEVKEQFAAPYSAVDANAIYKGTIYFVAAVL